MRYIIDKIRGNEYGVTDNVKKCFAFIGTWQECADWIDKQ